MRRIYVEIYLAVIAAAVVTAVGVGAFGHWYFDGRLEAEREALRAKGAVIVAELGDLDAGSDLEDRLRALAATHEVSAVLRDSDGGLIAVVGRGAARRARDEDPELAGEGALPGWHGPSEPAPPWHDGDRSRRRLPSRVWASVPLESGHALELAPTRRRPPPRFGPWIFGVFFLGSIAVAAYPVARRITRGLERLRAGVAELGEGDLSARVEVEGRNEVADVARAFNAAAEKLEHAVAARSRMLASASHELRSPLGRLRAAVELLAEGRPDLLAEAERDVGELDALIGDLLLAARLEAGAGETPREPVDLVAIARDEAERAGAAFEGSAPSAAGDARMLRRLVRNLLENARRHGAPPIAVHLETDPPERCVRIVVIDAGAGVPPEERERIFEPFYRPAGHSESADGGVGLGLALVAEIAAHHGGVARCSEAEGGGTRLVVELPMPPASAD